MNYTECPVCLRWWNDTDNTGVCPNGHETRDFPAATDEEHHLRKVTW